MTTLEHEFPDLATRQQIMRDAQRLRAEHIRGLITGLIDRFKARRRANAAYAELMDLDERTLADIGITRGDIPQIAAGAYVPFRGSATPTQPAPAANQDHGKIAA